MWDYIRPELIFLVRILGAALLGFIVGFERKMRLKEAGIRTHAIVCIGACLVMIVSKYGFADITNYDASRIAAQVISGVSFLGAGIIIYKREALRGLTTAAGIWTTAAIGLCVGSGLYIVSVGATLILLVVQFIMHARIKLFASKEQILLNIVFSSSGAEIEQIKEIFEIQKLMRLKTNRDGENISCSATLRTRKMFTDSDMAALLRKYDFISSIEIMPEEY